MKSDQLVKIIEEQPELKDGILALIIHASFIESLFKRKHYNEPYFSISQGFPLHFA